MRLLDRIALCNQPYIVASNTGQLTRLAGAADLHSAVSRCPLRFVMSDELTALCTDLAYSKGTSLYDCLDLIRIPAESLWVEWSDRPWRERLRQFGFASEDDPPQAGGRRGLLLRASKDGLRGTARAVWTVGDGDMDVLASAMEAHFYLDGDSAVESTARGESPHPERLYVRDERADPNSSLTQCFHFEFERSWEAYYRDHVRSPAEYRKIQLHSAGAVASAVPVLLAFLLLLNTRDGLPQRAPPLDRLNRARAQTAKRPLLDHIEVRAPLCQAPATAAQPRCPAAGRRAPRLHHVRGHLMRRANQLIWRSPHVRGSARVGAVRSRTVTWTLERRLPADLCENSSASGRTSPGGSQAAPAGSRSS